MKQATRQQVIATARQYLGVRYVHQGTTEYGLDCRGLLLRVVGDLELSDEDFAQPKFNCYPTSPVDDSFHRVLDEYLTPIDLADATLGDVLLIRFQKDPQHVAFITEVQALGEWKVIHALTLRGVVEHDLGARWLRNYRGQMVGAYALPNVS